MLEIVPSGTCKGNGVRILLDHLGISSKEVMAIGDGENDVEMLELVSFGVALKNGAEKTKAVADVIGANNDEDGVSQAIYQDTTVKKVDDPNSGIPKYKFDFVSNNVVALRVGQQSELTDIAGVLRGLSGVITITTRDGFQTIKRDLELENVSGSVLAATLWSENTNLVDDSVLTLKPQPVIVVMTSTLVKLYKDSLICHLTWSNQSKSFICSHLILEAAKKLHQSAQWHFHLGINICGIDFLLAKKL